MSKQKRFTIGAVIFYLWYVYSGAVLLFTPPFATDVLYKVLKAFAPLTWIDGEAAGSIMYIGAPILFLAATVIIDLLSELKKTQKIVLTVMPVVSYALFWVFVFIADAHFGY